MSRVSMSDDQRRGFAGGAVAIALSMTLVACAGSERSAGDAVVWDSAGIRIVENAVTNEECVVASTANLDLGLVDGPTEYQFYRVFDAATLSDGRIALVNQGSDQVRVFNPEGEFELAFGSRGGGPGEFNDVFQLWVARGDTLIVADYRPWRFSFFTDAGSFVRSVVPEPLYPNTPNQFEPLADGTFLMAQSSGGMPEVEGDWWERTLHVVRHTEDGSLLDTVAVLPHGRQGWLDLETRYMGTPMFEAQSQVAAAGIRVITSDGTTYELSVFDMAGPEPGEASGNAESVDWSRPTDLIRWQGPDLTVTADDVEAYRRQQLEAYADVDVPMLRRAAEASVSSDRPVAERFPAHGPIRIGLQGDMWVYDYPRPREEEAGWLVFDAEGRFQCRTILPFENTWDLYEIGPDYVLGKMTDELDVEHVRRFLLERPED